jgi:hypothetical protein
MLYNYSLDTAINSEKPSYTHTNYFATVFVLRNWGVCGSA